eukprot:10879418-Lingulodinium_polyedra.AAC.1
MDLQTVKWQGGDKMDDFIRNYRFILSNLKADIPDKILLDTLLIQVRKSKELVTDLHWFERLEDEDPMKTQKHLLDLIQRQVSRTRMLANREKQEKALQNPGKAFAGAPAEQAAPGEPTSPTPKQKGKGKGKGKVGKDKNTQEAGTSRRTSSNAGKIKKP